ncbi:hypothetical protein B0H13DRAFT_2318896 [Mycena leptocephala]|nr:hypothetical protein B0H13DRAFT_2318896 [Mycena leptocephala]
MSETYLLHVQSVNGISWKPGWSHHETPNLYAAILQDGIEVLRTKRKRELAPKWDYSLKMCSSSDSPSSVIALRLCHDSSRWGGDICVGVVHTDVAALLQQCASGSDGNAKSAKLELTGVDGKLKGKPAGTLSVRLMGDVEAAATVVEQAQRNVEQLGLSATSALMKTAEVAANSSSKANDIRSALATITLKLELIVGIGDKIAAVMLSSSIR